VDLNRKAIVKLLLDNGCNVNIRNKDRFGVRTRHSRLINFMPTQDTALHSAAIEGRPEIARILIDHKADVIAARRAIHSLASSGDATVRFRDQQLKPPTQPDRKLVSRLIAQLDDKTFQVRKDATAELKQLGPRVTTPLEKAAKKTTSIEVRRRCRKLLDAIRNGFYKSARMLQRVRAVEVLGRIHTPAAITLPKRLNDSRMPSRVSIEAAHTLARQRGARQSEE
jgi:HEAT repeat protein